jgi:glycosyltransferase involved in cell wall biosynthesis
MRILITVPNKEIGGVANYFQVLKGYLRYKDIIYQRRGSKSSSENLFKTLIRLLIDYINFIYNLLFKNVDLVLINTSLGKSSINRDLIFIIIAKILKSEVVLFIHGWNKKYEEIFFVSSNILKSYFFKCDSYIVLSKEFQSKLVNFGVDKKVNLLTTIVDDNFASYSSVDGEERENINLLFLARIKKQKGVLETLKAFQILKRSSKYNLKLLIAGDGPYLDETIAYIEKKGLKDVEILGFVKGNQKVEVFKKSDLYLFPTNHGEGMPTTVLEAMSMGLPVITTSVGGITDFFEGNKMGVLLDSTKPAHIAEKVQYLLNRPVLIKEISEYNYNYAKEHFYASKVAKRLEVIINEVAQN